MLLIAAALQEELKVALALCRNPQKARLRGVEIWSALLGKRKIHFLKTGVGPKKSSISLQRALELLDVSQILVIGYAGALDPRLKLGSLVAVDKALACKIDKSNPAVENIKLERAFTLSSGGSFPQMEETMQLPIIPGDTLTTAHVWGSPIHKKVLREKFGASIVDMETASLAAVADSFGIPLHCLRAVSDEAGDSFLEPFSYDPSAGISKRAGQILRKGNPAKVFREWKCNTSVARVSLTRFLESYL
ncbi:MAG: hypothetical protein P8Z37_14815 [Acidobacteriota bacterium]